MKFSRASILVAGFAAVCASGQTQPADFSTGQAARLVIGQKNFTTADFGATNTLLGSPSGIAWANGILWVADANRLGSTPNNNRVVRFSDTSTYPSPTADPTIPGTGCGVCRGTASLVLGQPDFVTSSQSLTPTGMRSPTGVATDGTILVVADTDNNRVLIWRSLPRANGQPADIVIGQPDFTHNATSVPPTATSLRGPSGVWLADGKLYVADSQDNRVLIYNRVPTSNNAAADVVVGQPNFTSFVQPDLTQSNGTPAADNMQTPVSVTTDGARMYVTDLGQNRIMIWNRIPTSNGTPADLALGQPDLTSAIDNNSKAVCASNGVDSSNNPTYPARCSATMSFPRYALSDGRRLFVADGGNDRVLVYKSIPTASGQAADVVLGQPNDASDNAGQNPDGTDAFQTPVGLAWDGGNLYVSDTYNRRIVVYTPGVLNIPLAAVRNAASLEIYAIGSVNISGTIVAKDTVTITIGGTAYTYTIVADDTLTTIADKLKDLIDKAPDPNVTASVDNTTNTIVMTARTPGQGGSSITLAVSTSTNAQIVPTASGANLNIYLQNPTSIAPGTLVEIFGSNLCDNAAVGDTSGSYLPFSIAGCQVFIDGVPTPLLYVSPSQINAQMPLEFGDRTSVSLYARATHADGSVTVTSPVAVTIVKQNPGIFAQGGTDPRPGILYHGASSATDVISVDGAVNKGDVATITIGGNAYAYTVKDGDTLPSIRDAFVALINSDPNVVATAANEYQRIVLSARTPGPAGEGTTVTAAVTGTNASLILTVFNAVMCCSNSQGTQVTPANPAIPGEILYLFATGLGPTNPPNVDTGQIFQGGSQNPPGTPVDSILTGGKAANILSVSLVPGLAGVYYVQFQLSTAVTTDANTQITIAQQAFVSNVVTFPVQAPATASAVGGQTPAARPANKTARQKRPVTRSNPGR